MVEGAHKSAKLILDCGATSHMFRDRTFFTSYSMATSHETVSVRDACNIPVVGQGSVHFRSILSNGFQTVTLHRALHIPKLAANLVSLGKLQQEGASVASYKKGLSVSLHGDELLRGSLIGNTGTLYHIQCLKLQKNAMHIATSGSLHLWHPQMGHLHIDAIREMLLKDMVDGLAVSLYNYVCKGCLGKSHRLLFPKVSTTKYDKMDLIIIDLAGPMSVETWSGMLHALVVVKVACQTVAHLLQSKDEAAAALKDTVAMLERQSGKLLK